MISPGLKEYNSNSMFVKIPEHKKGHQSEQYHMVHAGHMNIEVFG